jgi:ATPase subunit of ABC transporter with duplicated ATPase domains
LNSYSSILSFSAKIGILGINGSGKSTLLKILAGTDSDYDGAVKIFPGIKVGYLSQEPELDEDLNVEENILLGIEDKLDILDRYEEV